MVISHTLRDDVLRVTVLRELDVTTRAAAALQVEALVAAHHPRRVLVALPTATPSPATLSALARVHRMCRSLGIPISATGPGAAWDQDSGVHASERMETGARRER
ncbi:hypothetical protein ACIGBL_31600 [Streptomyces sp. NPDC085614]|uniref:hypothetical protein n=1 Tax=unclassified Streptomyces TaxID=2593676 RepID=UPI00164FFBCB|nr:hypothetical protein [Streptomyces sp. ms191]